MMLQLSLLMLYLKLVTRSGTARVGEKTDPKGHVEVIRRSFCSVHVVKSEVEIVFSSCLDTVLALLILHGHLPSMSGHITAFHNLSWQVRICYNNHICN